MIFLLIDSFQMLSGSVAGVVGWVSICPLEVVKNRIQVGTISWPAYSNCPRNTQYRLEAIPLDLPPVTSHPPPTTPPSGKPVDERFRSNLLRRRRGRLARLHARRPPHDDTVRRLP